MPFLPTTPHPAEIDWWLETNTITHTSPLSRSTQTLSFPGARWRASLSYRNLLRAEIDALSAFVNGLRGPVGRVLMPPLQQVPVEVFWPEATSGYWKAPEVGYLSSPISTSTGMTSFIVRFSGADNDHFPQFDFTGRVPIKAGYFFSVQGELKQCVATPAPLGMIEGHEDYGRNLTTITFTPPLRRGFWDQQYINFINPVTNFRLTDDNQGRVTYGPGGRVGSMIIDLVEVFE